VLLDSRLGMGLHELLDICRHMDRLNLFELQLALFAPIRKSRDRDEVCFAGIPVADVRGEEFPEALTTLLERRKSAGTQPAGAPTAASWRAETGAKLWSGVVIDLIYDNVLYHM